ncbi:hypothetical protein [Jannaschia aquimarina]|nr:hypothetical protein [Jannaschia aquimarina]
MPRQRAIIGTGPSLRGQDLSSLPAHGSILLNGALTLLDGALPSPLALCVEDERFVHRHHAMFARFAPGIPWWLLSVSAIRALASYDPDLLSKGRIVLIDDIRKPYMRSRQDDLDLARLDHVEAGDGALFSLDPSKGIAGCGTVAFTALQFAMAAGSGDVVLAGVDLTDGTSRFYEEGEGAGSGLDAGQDRIAAHFALALSVAERGDIRLLCASDRSLLLRLGYSPAPLPSARAAP